MPVQNDGTSPASFDTDNTKTTMKKRITLTVSLAALAASPWLVRADDDSEQTEFPKIISQPTDQGIWEGTRTTFNVRATNGDISFQWRRNGVALEGQTNSDLTIDSVAIGDVGLYSCDVSKKDGNTVPTRAASLNMLSETLGGGPITVFGTPIASGGSQSNTCPGAYAGYVNYLKTASQGWGWSPSSGTSIHTATDTNRSDTKVQYLGKVGDKDCNITTVSVPDPTISTKYRFTVYFTNNVPTNAYGIQLEGFDP
jgi:hypothetical protein